MTAKLYAAMAKAFPAIEGALKDSSNPHFKSKYADLSSVVDAIKPALVSNDLFFAQINHEQTGGVCVETVVCHSSGEQMSFGKLFVPAGKNDAQGYGSALTYARRYSLMTAFGVCPEDDDGNAAVRTTPQNDQTQQYQQPADSEGYVGVKGGKMAIKAIADQFVRDLHSCSDQDMLAAFVTSPTTKQDYNRIKREWPGYLTGAGFPEEFEAIDALIKRLKAELPEASQAEAAE